MGTTMCGNDLILWQKKAIKETLGTEINLMEASEEILRSTFKFHIHLLLSMLSLNRYLKKFNLEHCASSCPEWGSCVSEFHQRESKVLEMLQIFLFNIDQRAVKFRLPILFDWMIRNLRNAMKELDDRVENLAIVKDSENRELLANMSEVCKEAALKLKDWRETMDFLQ